MARALVARFALYPLALLLALTAFFPAPLLAAEEPVDPPHSQAELQQRIESILRDHHVPGAGVALADGRGPLWVAGIGKANVSTGEAATADTLFRVGSVSKMWVALAALKLAHEGKLDLQATVKQLAPEIAFENPWEATDPVRVVHLLEHTSGLDDMNLREFESNDPKPLTLKEGLDVSPSRRRARSRPGTLFCYSNVGPPLVAYLIEKVTGERYEDYVARTFLKPLGMEAASFLLTPETQARLTRLYEDDGRTEVPYWHVVLRPSGSFNASPREMSSLVTLLVNRGSVGDTQILPGEAIDRMETPTTSLGARAGMTAGYGLHNFTLMNDEGFLWHGHNGALEGARAELFYLRPANVGYFQVINGGNSEASLAIGKLLRAYLTREVRAPSLPPAAAMGAEPRVYAGWYEPATQRVQSLYFLARIAALAHLRPEEGGLSLRSLIGKLAGEYVAVSPTLYRRPKDPEASLALLPLGPDGQRIQSLGLTLRAIPGWVAWARIVVTALALVLIPSVLLFALVWVPRRLLGRMKGVRHLGARVWLLFTALAFGGVVFLFVKAYRVDYTSVRFGSRTPWSMALTASTVLFALLSAVSLVASVRVPRREVSRGVYVHTLLTSVVLGVVTAYLLSEGVIGIRTWTL